MTYIVAASQNGCIGHPFEVVLVFYTRFMYKFYYVQRQGFRLCLD